MVNSEVFLVVETDAGGVFGNTFVFQGINQIDSLIDNNFLRLRGILRKFKVELVAGEGLNGKVSSTNGTFMADDVCSLGDLTGQDVVYVRLVCFHQNIFTSKSTHNLAYNIANIQTYPFTFSIDTYSKPCLL